MKSAAGQDVMLTSKQTLSGIDGLSSSPMVGFATLASRRLLQYRTARRHQKRTMATNKPRLHLATNRDRIPLEGTAENVQQI